MKKVHIFFILTITILLVLSVIFRTVLHESGYGPCGSQYPFDYYHLFGESIPSYPPGSVFFNCPMLSQISKVYPNHLHFIFVDLLAIISLIYLGFILERLAIKFIKMGRD